MEDNRWIVYEHISPSGMIYVGITSNLKERWKCNGYHYCTYNSIFGKAIKKYGWDKIIHRVVVSGVGYGTACNMEKDLIAFNKAKGISYNIANGGQGTLGRMLSEETKSKIGKAHVGISLSQEHKDAISKGRLNSDKAKNASRLSLEKAHLLRIGTHHSIQTKQKISEAAKGRDMSKAIEAAQQQHREKAIPIIVTKDGTLIGEFQLQADIVKTLGLDGSNVSRALKRGLRVDGYSFNYKRGTVYGFE